MDALSDNRATSSCDDAPPPPGHSPFARQVAEDIALPNVDANYMFGLIKDGVENKTSKLDPVQTPYTYGSLGTGHYFNTNQVLENLPQPSPAIGLLGAIFGGQTTAAQVATQITPAPIVISDQEWAITDGPVLLLRVLRNHTPQDIKRLAEGGDANGAYFLGYPIWVTSGHEGMTRWALPRRTFVY